MHPMSETTNLIKEIRSFGMSQGEISRRTGVPQSRICRWEAGRTPDSADDALKLAELAKKLAKQAKREARKQPVEA